MRKEPRTTESLWILHGKVGHCLLVLSTGMLLQALFDCRFRFNER